MTEDLAGEEAAAARHGSYCPKLCTFACPVTAATGRDDAVPWSFHRAVTDLADGRLGPGPTAGARLAACSGCLACRVPCEFDQDVPAQVRAGRRYLFRAGAPVEGAAAAVASVAAGRSPLTPGTAPPEPPAAPPDAVGDVAVLAGCRDGEPSVTAAVRLLAAAGIPATPRPAPGCCGAVLDDLGAEEDARAARDRTGAALQGYGTVLVLDPHCLPSVAATVPADVEVRHLVDVLDERVAAGHLAFARREGIAVTYHDPCMLARRDGVTEAPRRLLAATGARIVEPEHHGQATRCSGAGLAMELVDPAAAGATAAARRAELLQTGATPVTACARAGVLLADGTRVRHLVEHLADHLSSPS